MKKVRPSEQKPKQLDVVFLFVDGVYEAVRHSTNGQALLCAWAICADGTKRFLHLAPVQSETQEACELFFEGMQHRGFRQPLPVISDGAPGLISAITKRFPKADRQRCIARNLLQKLPSSASAMIWMHA